MTYPSILESYSWLTSDMTVNDAPGNKVIIRGPALFSFEKFFKKGVSRNKRRYIQSEVVRSARTLKNVPIDVNHEISLWEERGKIGSRPVHKGHVIFGEEENGTVEYTAEINHKEYVQKIRDTDKVRKGVMTEKQYFDKWFKAPIVGVSVDADFLKLTCSRCGETFEEFPRYKEHMFEKHGLKDVSVQPFGITFKRLSLVEPPQQPGVLGADFEIVETTSQGMYRLYESITNLKETDEMKKQKKQSTKTKKVKETKTPEYLNIQEDLDIAKTVAVEETPEVGGNIPPLDVPEPISELPVEEKPAQDCADGFHWDEEAKGCLPDAVEKEPLPPEGELPPALDVSDIPLIPPVTEQAVAPTEPETPTVPDEPTCPEGSHYDKELGSCQPDGADLGTTPKDPDTPITEIALPAKLRLGEPFSSYKDFADCVAKNQDKKDPEAYCATIKQKTEGDGATEIKESANVYENMKAITEAVQKGNIHGLKRAVKTAEAVNKLGEAVAKEHIDRVKVSKNLNNTILLEARLRAGSDKRTQKRILEVDKHGKTTDIEVARVSKTTNKALETIGHNEKKIVESFTKKVEALTLSDGKLREYTDTKLGQLATSQAKQKNDIATKFNAQDKRITELKTSVDQLTSTVASLVETVAKEAEHAKTLKDMQERYDALMKEQEEKPVEHKCPDGEHWSKEENKCVPNESTINELKKLTEIVTTRMDNLEAKVKPKFDGHNAKGEPTEPELDAETPYQK